MSYFRPNLQVEVSIRVVFFSASITDYFPDDFSYGQYSAVNYKISD